MAVSPAKDLIIEGGEVKGAISKSRASEFKYALSVPSCWPVAGFPTMLPAAKNCFLTPRLGPSTTLQDRRAIRGMG